MRTATWIGILAVVVAITAVMAAVATTSTNEPSSPRHAVDRTRPTRDRRARRVEREVRPRVLAPVSIDTDRHAPQAEEAIGRDDEATLPGSDVRETDRPAALDAAAVRAELEPYEGLESVRVHMRYDRTLLTTLLEARRREFDAVTRQTQ